MAHGEIQGAAAGTQIQPDTVGVRGVGGPYEYTAKKLDDAHFRLHISPEVFDEVAPELNDALDYFKVPQREKDEVLAAFNAHKPDVTAGFLTSCA